MLLSFSTKFVIQSEAKNLGNTMEGVNVYVPKILRYALNDKKLIIYSSPL